jgi:hypothetical protein
MAYTKLFHSILASTIWQESKETKILWVTMLAMTDRDGVVAASVPGLAKMAGLTVPETRTALECLLAPDPDSRTEDFEGRRIAKCDGGWQVLNHRKYRNLECADRRREQVREAVAKHRAKKKAIPLDAKARIAAGLEPLEGGYIPRNDEIAPHKENHGQSFEQYHAKANGRTL